nr:thioredoxin-like protein CXXS1 [Ipomoea batatas]GMC51865.1 thioredoxin-like protein CXXS1 [Ipomoea batatas]GMC53821.1 thioredoxin-like protein CXXS1 [Ipomoea batatas]
MGFEEGQKRCKVIKIDSKQTWDIFMYHAKNQARPEVAAEMEIKAMPTFMFMRDGVEVVDKLVGANPEEIRNRIAAAFINSTT